MFCFVKRFFSPAPFLPVFQLRQPQLSAPKFIYLMHVQSIACAFHVQSINRMSYISNKKPQSSLLLKASNRGRPEAIFGSSPRLETVSIDLRVILRFDQELPPWRLEAISVAQARWGYGTSTVPSSRRLSSDQQVTTLFSQSIDERDDWIADQEMAEFAQTYPFLRL